MTIKNAIEAALAEVNDWSTFLLSDEAGCSSPDSASSEGATFLANVRDATVELIESHLDEIEDAEWFDSANDDGSVSEIADGAPSIYTHQLWSEFTDLGAYNEDPTDLGFDDTTDMNRLASVCLYIIAERLANAVLFHVREAVESAEEEDEGQEDD